MADKKKTGSRLWTVPNVISMIRILLIIPIVDLLRQNFPETYLTAFILIVIAYLTDFLDGFIARVFHSESDIGQILDPLGDKLLAVIVAAVLYFGKKLDLYFFVLIFLRDLIISMGAIYVLNFKKQKALPMLSGKITTVVLGAVLALYPLSYSQVMIIPIAPQFTWGNIIGPALLIGTLIASALLVFSGVFYCVNYYKTFLSKQGAKTK